MYVPHDCLPSVQQHGYLSTRAQREILGTLATEQYALQFTTAAKRSRNLQERLNVRQAKLKHILGYLEEVTDEDTASAIYCLYYPVPDDPVILNYIKQQRGDFLRGRVLLRCAVDEQETKLHPMGRQVLTEERVDRQYWLGIWLREMLTHDDREESGWFENIPHAYFIPPSGRVNWRRLQVVDPAKY